MNSVAIYHIGTSGWHYDVWRGRFYPPDLPKAEWLAFYSKHFSTVELNNTFYRLPSEDAFTNWYDSSPPRFTFALKASRFITHIKRLKDAAQPVDNFLKRARLLKEKLGPILYQLPPGMSCDDERLEAFLNLLTGDRKHVFEFRHPSWLDENIYEILRRHNAGLCIYDMPAFTTPIVATADFAYVRFHGSDGLYSGSYSDEQLAAWAKNIAALSRKLREVYIYFNNDVAGYAIDNARTIRAFLEKETR